MTGLIALTDHPAAVRLSLALVHFLWQGAALAFIAVVLLSMLRKASAGARCLGLLIVFAAMAACPVVTFALTGDAPAPVAASAPESVPREQIAASPPPGADTRLPPVSAGLEPESQTSHAAPVPKGPDPWLARLRNWAGARLPWVTLLWSTGVVVLSLRLLTRWWAVGRARGALESASVDWQHKLTSLAQRLRMRRPVRLLTSAASRVPMVIGWLRPVIVVPTSALTGLTPDQLAAILTHELAHIRRFDHFVNLAQTVVEILLFYHPAVWWVSGAIRAERENCCDDVAVRVSGDVVGYMRALAWVEQNRAGLREAAIASSGTSLLSRIRRLAGGVSLPAAGYSWLAAAMALGVVMVLPIAAAVSGIAAGHVPGQHGLGAGEQWQPQLADTDARLEQPGHVEMIGGAAGESSGREVRLHGIVRLATGRPAGSMDVFLDVWGRRQEKLKTGADGSYSITLSDAPRLVEFRAGAAGFSEVLLVSPKEGEDEVGLDVSLHPIPVLTGTVRLPDGKPAANIVLDMHGSTWREYDAVARAHSWTMREGFGASGGGVLLTLTTDQAGHYRLPLRRPEDLRESQSEPLPEGWGEGTEYRLHFISAQGAGWAGPLTLTVDPKVAEPSMDIRLRAGDQLDGTVVGFPGRRPMAGADVIVAMPVGAMMGREVVVAQAAADAQGRFRIRAALPPGGYRVGAAAGEGWGFIGLPEGQARALRGAKVAQRRVVELQLVRDAVVPVRFLDPSGEPVRNATVSMNVTAGAGWGDEIKTDADGRHVFEIRSREWVKEHWAYGAAHLQVEAMATQFGLTAYFDVDLTAERRETVEVRMDRPVTVYASRPQEKPRTIPIQGKLLVTTFGEVGETGEGDSFLVAGSSDNVSPIPLSVDQADLSPDGREVVYCGASDTSPPSSRHLWKASVRGAGPVDLSARAKLTGVSCAPCWSPDGRMIAFQHSRPKKGESPCDTGFQIWVMNADGTGVRQVTPAIGPGLSDWSPRWTADGSGVVHESYDGFATMKIDGTQRRVLARGLGHADLARDGSRAVVARSVMGEANGQRGDWRQLVLVDVATGARHVLVQQFVSESQVAAHVKRAAPGSLPETEAPARALGPSRPRWSPDGRQIAFLAALPFDPKGPLYRQQVEVWVYDLRTRDLIRITEDRAEQSWLSWR